MPMKTFPVTNVRRHNYTVTELSPRRARLVVRAPGILL